MRRDLTGSSLANGAADSALWSASSGKDRGTDGIAFFEKVRRPIILSSIYQLRSPDVPSPPWSRPVYYLYREKFGAARRPTTTVDSWPLCNGTQIAFLPLYPLPRLYYTVKCNGQLCAVLRAPSPLEKLFFLRFCVSVDADPLGVWRYYYCRKKKLVKLSRTCRTTRRTHRLVVHTDSSHVTVAHR